MKTIRPAILSDVAALLQLESQAFSCDRLNRRSFRHAISSSASELIIAESHNTDNADDINATPISSIIFASIIPLEFARYKDIADWSPVLKALLNINFQYSLFFIIFLFFFYSTTELPTVIIFTLFISTQKFLRCSYIQ